MIKKISTLFIVFSLVVGGTLFLKPNKTYAQLGGPVTEVGPNLFTNTVSTGEDIWQTTKEVALIPAVTMITDRLLNKISGDVINWANGGFDGDPGFINNWDYFLKDTAYLTIGTALNTAVIAANEAQQNSDQNNINITLCETEAYEEWTNEIEALDSGDSLYETEAEIDAVLNSELAACQDLGSNFYGNLGSIAQQNYQLWQSGEAVTPRNVARTIASFGANELNVDAVDSLIAGEGNTLKRLLGSQQAVNQFSNDITVGGWTGYIALADPHNYPSGLDSLVTNALGQKTANKVSSVVQDAQTPVKFLDKKTCSNGSDPIDGKCPEGEQIVTKTPGDLVADKLKTQLSGDESRAKEFSDVLVGSLVSAIGQMTNSLINTGFSSLSSTANNALFGADINNTNFIAAGATGNYQSEYDVLGIESNITSTGTPGTTGTSGGGTSLFDSEGSYVFIGGPEDQGNGWNTGSQVIINFKEDLDKNIKYAEEEEGYFIEAKNALNSYKNTAINMDRCLPGPDYNWEERYKDRWSTFGSDDTALLNQIGLSETKEMVSDPLVNIPGSQRMQDTFLELLSSTQQEAIQLNQRESTVTNVVRTLNSIKDDVTAQLNTIILGDADLANMVLFTSDWELLSSTQKTQAIETASIGFTKSDGSESGSYIQIKTDEGETAETILTNNPTRAKNAVFSMAWDIWRDGTPNEEKKNLRYSYYVLENDLSNEQFVAQAQANLYRITRGGEESEKLLNDCLILKAYALGTEVSELATATSGSNQSSITETLASLNPYLGTLNAISSIFGGGSIFGPSGQEFTFIELDDARSDDEIRDFLEQQYTLYSVDPDSSLFQTEHLIKPSAIQYSILGFDDSVIETVSVQTSAGTDEDLPDYDEVDLPQTEAYFQTNYPDYGFKSEIKNKYEIKDMFKYDRFYSGFNRARGVTGTLYCRNPRTFDAIDGTPDNSRSVCIKSWYISTNLDYETAFAGI